MGIPPSQFQAMQDRLNRVTHRTPPADAVPLESTLHRDIMDWCSKQWPVWIAVSSRMDKRTTQMEGTPDFFIIAPGGKLLIVECKAKGNKQTTGQLSWAARVRMLGHVVHVCYSFGEFLEVTKI